MYVAGGGAERDGDSEGRGGGKNGEKEEGERITEMEG